MYFQMFLSVLGFIGLWGFFYKYKKRPKLFFITGVLYLLAIAFYILSSPYRLHRLSSFFESLFS